MERGRKNAAAPNARFVSTRATGSYSDGKRVALSPGDRGESLSFSLHLFPFLAERAAPPPKGGGKSRAGRGMWDTCFQGPDYPPSPSYTRTSLCSRNVPVDKTPEARARDVLIYTWYEYSEARVIHVLGLCSSQMSRSDISAGNPAATARVLVVLWIIFTTGIARRRYFSALSLPPSVFLLLSLPRKFLPRVLIL